MRPVTSPPRRFLIPALLLLAALTTLTTFFACSPAATAEDDFAYAAVPFTATVRGTFTRTASDGYTGNPALTGQSLTNIPQSVTATVSLSAPDANGERGMSVTFTEPAALAGVTVTATYESPAVGASDTPVRTVTFTYPSTYGNITVSDTAGAFDGLLRFAEALLPTGDILAVSPLQEDGTHTVTRRTGDGAREAVFTFEEGVLLPLRVTVTDASGRVELVVSP